MFIEDNVLTTQFIDITVCWRQCICNSVLTTQFIGNKLIGGTVYLQHTVLTTQFIHNMQFSEDTVYLQQCIIDTIYWQSTHLLETQFIGDAVYLQQCIDDSLLATQFIGDTEKV